MTLWNILKIASRRSYHRRNVDSIIVDMAATDGADVHIKVSLGLNTTHHARKHLALHVMPIIHMWTGTVYRVDFEVLIDVNAMSWTFLQNLY